MVVAPPAILLGTLVALVVLVVWASKGLLPLFVEHVWICVGALVLTAAATACLLCAKAAPHADRKLGGGRRPPERAKSGRLSCALRPELLGSQTQETLGRIAQGLGVPSVRAFLLTYGRHDPVLRYVAAIHTDDPASATWRFVAEALRGARAVVVEGIPFEPPGGVQWHAAGEVGHAQRLAAKAKIPCFGAEPLNAELAAALKAAGFSAEDILIHNLFTSLAVFFSRFGRPPRSLGELVRFAEKSDTALPQDWHAADAWFLRELGTHFTLAPRRSLETLRPDPCGTKLQRMSAVHFAARQRFQLDVVCRTLNTFGVVCCVMGNAHALLDYAALAEALGEPTLSLTPAQGGPTADEGPKNSPPPSPRPPRLPHGFRPILAPRLPTPVGLSVRASGNFNWYGSASESFDKALTAFASAHLSAPVNAAVHGLLAAAGHPESFWLALRATTPIPDFDEPRWHRDGFFFGQEVVSKFATVLLGPPTLFLTPDAEALAWFAANARNASRSALAARLAGAPRATAEAKTVVEFLNGPEGAIHSEPPHSADRIFVSVLPGTPGEIAEMAKTRGASFHKPPSA